MKVTSFKKYLKLNEAAATDAFQLEELIVATVNNDKKALSDKKYTKENIVLAKKVVDYLKVKAKVKEAKLVLKDAEHVAGGKVKVTDAFASITGTPVSEPKTDVQFDNVINTSMKYGNAQLTSGGKGEFVAVFEFVADSYLKGKKLENFKNSIEKIAKDFIVNQSVKEKDVESFKEELSSKSKAATVKLKQLLTSDEFVIGLLREILTGEKKFHEIENGKYAATHVLSFNDTKTSFKKVDNKYVSDIKEFTDFRISFKSDSTDEGRKFRSGYRVDFQTEKFLKKFVAECMDLKDADVNYLTESSLMDIWQTIMTKASESVQWFIGKIKDFITKIIATFKDGIIPFLKEFFGMTVEVVGEEETFDFSEVT